MFALLTEYLSQEEQETILAKAIDRKGKGLTAPQPFLELPLDSIVQAVIVKVMEYQKTYAEARLVKIGVTNLKTSIWCDRATELAIFLRGMSNDTESFDEALLSKYPLITRQELAQQTGGLKLGYWLLFAKMEDQHGISEETLNSIAEYLQSYVSCLKKEELEHFSFAEELDNYVNAKQRRARGRKTVCAITGQQASEASAAGSPYKVQCYSNRRPLGKAALTAQLSPQWQREMALRAVVFGKDELHEKVWIYCDSEINNMPMALMTPIYAIRTACKIAVSGGKALVSPSVVPYPIQSNYAIENFPDWLAHFKCEPSGDINCAERVLKVLNVFDRLHYVSSFGGYEASISLHGRRAMRDILYIPHVLPKESEANVRYIHQVLQLLSGNYATPQP